MPGPNSKSSNGSGSKSKAPNGKASAAPAAPLKPAAQIASAAEKYVAKKTEPKAAKVEAKPEPKVEAKAKETKAEPKPKAEPKGPTAMVAFGPGWKQDVKGDLVAGGTVTIQYDPARAQANHTQNGAPAWGVQAFVKLVPSGQVVEQPVIDFEGSKTAKARPATVELPRGTTEIQVWFKNWTGGDNQREQWDSNFGTNYRFPVRS